MGIQKLEGLVTITVVALDEANGISGVAAVVLVGLVEHIELLFLVVDSIINQND